MVLLSAPALSDAACAALDSHVRDGGKLLVIGCSKMFEKEFIRSGGMLNLFLNCVDALTLGDELINIRSHQPINRSIEPIGKMGKLWYRFMTILLVPVFIIAFGCVRVIIRKKEKENYIKSLSLMVE